jgi:hypothetical protein
MVPYNEDNQVLESAFVMDGTVQPGDTYFGTGSQYFTNLYPGLFVMVAKDITITDFEINGNIGSDGDGNADLFDYTLSLSGSNFSIYCKRVWDAGDPSINHIYIVNTIDENITHEADLSTDDDYDKIFNLTNVTQVHYLLFGLGQGVKPTNTQIENIVLDYLSIVDLSDINNTLSNLNLNYSAVTTNVPPNNQNYVSLEYKQHNFSGDTDYYEQYTFSDINYFADNYIGDYANLRNWNENDFLLSNNVFTNANDNTVDVMSNNFGDLFYNNSFGDDVLSNLFIGQGFQKNTFYDRFRNNIIKRNFNNNVWYYGEFNGNNIGDSFFNNWNSGGNFRNNVIGNLCYDNKIRSGGNLYENKIGNYFQNNNIHSSFSQNEIKDYVSSNNFYGNIEKNTLGQNFQNNIIWSQFYNNDVKVDTNQNNFGINLMINTYIINENSIGFQFYNNTIKGNFSNNEIKDYFQNNQIETNFSNNVIGSFFQSNTINEGFGFGGGSSQKNYIGDYFQNNNVGEYFYNNRVANYFQSNTLGNYFQKNNIETSVIGEDFTVNYGNIVTITNNDFVPSASDGVYSGLVGTGGNGNGASFNVTITSSLVTVNINQAGKQYVVGDTILILGSQIGGTDGVDDVTINIITVSTPPSVYEQYNCNIFQREAGSNRLSYYDSSDILTIKNINE